MEEETGKNKRKKIIFLIVLFVLAIICIFLVNYFSSKYNLKEASSIGIIGGADGPTAIYIAGNQTWENILVYLSIVILIDIIIFTIIKTIGNKRQKSFIKLNLLIIVCFNILAATLLFSSVSVILLFINIMIIIVFIVKTIYDKRKKKNWKKIG